MKSGKSLKMRISLWNGALKKGYFINAGAWSMLLRGETIVSMGSHENACLSKSLKYGLYNTFVGCASIFCNVSLIILLRWTIKSVLYSKIRYLISSYTRVLITWQNNIRHWMHGVSTHDKVTLDTELHGVSTHGKTTLDTECMEYQHMARQH